MSNTQDPIKLKVRGVLDKIQHGYYDLNDFESMLNDLTSAGDFAALQSTSTQPPGDAREAFEAWGRTQGTPEQGWWFRQLDDGSYSAHDPDVAWTGFKAGAAWQSATAQASLATDAYERALSELVDKIAPGLDTGDLLADARTVSAKLDTTAQASEPPGWRDALKFYAEREHFSMIEQTAWDTVSGEPQNFWCDEAGTAMVEDGTVAAMALKGAPLLDEEAYEDLLEKVELLVRADPAPDTDLGRTLGRLSALLVAHESRAFPLDGNTEPAQASEPSAASIPLKEWPLYVFATEVFLGSYKPEELSSAALKAMQHQKDMQGRDPGIHPAAPARAVEPLTDAIATEREACAKAAEEVEEPQWFGYECPHTFQDGKLAAAVAIRARGITTTPAAKAGENDHG